MGLLDRLWSWLTSSGSRSPRKAHPDLYPIDVDRIARELRLADDARRLGEAGLPSPDATVLSGPEAQIVQRVEKARQDYVDWGALRLNVLNGDIGRQSTTKDVNRARQADKEFERKASSLLAEQDAVVRGLGEIARKRKAELEAFRASHQLTREAHYPAGAYKYLLYSVLLALVVVEGLLNAKFFAQGLDSGLLGGFVEAGIMAGINVGIAFGMGKYAIRYVNHVNVLPKLLGGIALLASMVIMGCIGLGIAHYRDSLTAEIVNPSKAALDAFIDHPMKLKDFFSWALFAISMMFAVGALFDGLYSDDLYPGYGSISRRAEIAVEDHEAELDVVRTQLEELKDQELKGLDATLQRAQASVGVLEQLIHDKRMSGSRLSTALLDADHSLDALLKKFRTENELHRKAAPRPAYFDKQPDLKPIGVPDFDTAADVDALRGQQEAVTRLLDEEQDIRARIQAAFTQQFDRLKPLDLHFPSKGVT